MATNTLVSFNGVPTYYSRDVGTNVTNTTLYTNATILHVNSNANNMFETNVVNTAFINYSTLKKFDFSYVNSAWSMFKNVDFKGSSSGVSLNFDNLSDGRNLFFNTNFNAAVKFGNRLNILTGAFYGCKFFNQNIILPEGLNYADNMFNGATNFKQYVSIPSTLRNGQNMFKNSGVLGVSGNGYYLKNIDRMFENCKNLQFVNLNFTRVGEGGGWTNFAFRNSGANIVMNVTFGQYSGDFIESFANCPNIGGNFYFYSASPNMWGSFYNVGNGARRNLFVRDGRQAYFTRTTSATNSITANDITYQYNSENKCYYNTLYNFYIYHNLSL